MTDPDAIQRLVEENKSLQEQVKHLVRLDRRLFHYQLEADRQLRHIKALNRFALDVLTMTSLASIARHAIEMLFEVTVLEQGIAWIAEDGAMRPVAHSALPGLETAGALDSVVNRSALEPARLEGRPILFDAHDSPSPELEQLRDDLRSLFGVSPGAPSAYVYIPLIGRQHGLLGALLLRKLDPSTVTIHERLLDISDLPFLELLGSHIAAALQSALLHRELREAADVLEQRVQERTAERDAKADALQETQDQLVHAGKMAAVGTLVAGLSHELNNPITVILGFSQGLLRTPPKDVATRKGLEAIERQARRCADLVNALLDFSHRQPLAREACQLDTLLARVVDLSRTKANAKHIKLSLELDPGGLPSASVCATEVESAVLNLLNNALDASTTGDTVELIARQASRDAEEGIAIEVIDHGEGIPPHRLGRIFDPFFTTKPIGMGTGLGLSLARKIVESHGGTLELESHQGQGTRVSIWLPLKGPALTSSDLISP